MYTNPLATALFRKNLEIITFLLVSCRANEELALVIDQDNIILANRSKNLQVKLLRLSENTEKDAPVDCQICSPAISLVQRAG
jgi:uncharacterized protein YcfL